MRVWFYAAAFLLAAQVLAESSYVFFFSSAKVRAVEGISRQRARLELARAEFQRYSWLVQRGAASREEYDYARTVAELAELDLRLAETRAKHATLSLEVARSLDERGRRVPICKRKRQTDDNKMSPVLKKLTARPPRPAFTPEQESGTKMRVPDPPDPPRPDPPAPPRPDPPGPEVPPPKPPDPPDPGEGPPKPKPKPKPDSKPPEKSGGKKPKG